MPGRWRLNFKDASKAGNGDDGLDDGRRVLVTIKGNYTRKGEKIHIQWRDGIFWPEGVQTTLQRSAANAAIDEAFLRCLDVATSMEGPCARAGAITTRRSYLLTCRKLKESRRPLSSLLWLASFLPALSKSRTTGRGHHFKKWIVRA